MGTKIAPTYTILTLAYLEGNLYEIIRGKKNTIYKQNLLDHGKDTWITVSNYRNAYGATLTICIIYSYTLK